MDIRKNLKDFFLQEVHFKWPDFLKIKKEIIDFNQIFSGINERFSCEKRSTENQFIRIEDRLNQLDEMLERKFVLVEDKILSIEIFIDNFEKEKVKIKTINNLDNLTNRASEDYKRHLESLKTDISRFKETDQSVKRLAHLEERITLLEMEFKNIVKEQQEHGSCQNPPRPAIKN